jgi:hypothetical protein
MSENSSIEHKERAHSELGASSSKRWMNCPASVKLSEGIVSESSPYAQEGTIAHELAEHCLFEGVSPWAFAGARFNGHIVDEEMSRAVETYIEVVQSYENDHTETLIEQKISLEDIDARMFGTNDAAIIDPFYKLTIIDFKYGQGIPVDAKDNTQLMYYALGMLKGLDVPVVEMVIVQPRAIHSDGPVRKWLIPVTQLVDFKNTLKLSVGRVDIAAKSDKIYDHAFTGEWCRFCPVLPKCSEESKTVVLPKPEELTPEQLTKTLRSAKLVSEWVDSVESYALSQLQKGVKVPDYKLVRGRANRDWKDEDQVIKEFSDLFGEKIFSKKLMSPAQLEKLVGKENIAKFTHTPEGKLSITHSSDKRPAVEITSPLELLEMEDI